MTKIVQSIESEATLDGETSLPLIPKIIHIVWVGDERKRPDNCIQTWRVHHPDWEIKVWGNDSLKDHAWVNAKHIQAMWLHELNGVADMMRWEILYREVVLPWMLTAFVCVHSTKNGLNWRRLLVGKTSRFALV